MKLSTVSTLSYLEDCLSTKCGFALAAAITEHPLKKTLNILSTWSTLGAALPSRPSSLSVYLTEERHVPKFGYIIYVYVQEQCRHTTARWELSWLCYTVATLTIALHCYCIYKTWHSWVSDEHCCFIWALKRALNAEEKRGTLRALFAQKRALSTQAYLGDYYFETFSV